MRRVAISALVLGLLVATTAAFGVAEALKLERSPVGRVRLTHVLAPTCGCPHASALLAFRLRRANIVDAAVIDADGNPVRTLAAGSRRRRGPVVLRWDGRTDDGAVVPDGAYRVRLDFPDEDRMITLPNAVRVDTQAPEIELVSLAPRRLSPDGDGINDAAAIVWRSGERALPLVLVDGVVAFAASMTDPGTAAVEWDGGAHGEPLAAGRYLVALAARDVAGNVSAATGAIAVRIRYISIRESTVRARHGFVRFHVSTDAQRYTSEVFRRGRPGEPLVSVGPNQPAGAARLRLAPNMRPGRYVLRVTANGHSDEAIVIVPARR